MEFDSGVGPTCFLIYFTIQLPIYKKDLSNKIGMKQPKTVFSLGIYV